ncbi:MAG: hypothetical protein ACP5NR_08820, partial [Athalassotoga sp.]
MDYNNKNNDHDDEDDTEFENEENNNAEYEDDDAIEEEENFDQVYRQDIDELFADSTKNEEANPTDIEENEAEDQQEEEAQDDDAQEDPEPEAQPERVQPPRNRQAPVRLTYAQSKGKEKHVKFDITVNSEDVEEYNQQYAMLIANCMAEINAKATMYGSCYG